MDLHAGNILIDPETEEITAILDWEHSRVYPYENEHYEWDLVNCWFDEEIVSKDELKDL